MTILPLSDWIKILCSITLLRNKFYKIGSRSLADGRRLKRTNLLFLAGVYKLKVKYPDDKGEDVAKLTIEDQGPKQCVMVRELILESFALSLSLSLYKLLSKSFYN